MTGPRSAIRRLFLQPKNVYSIAAAAGLLAITVYELRAWIEAGQIETEDGGGVTIPWSEIVAEMLDFVSAHSTWLAGEIPGFADALGMAGIAAANAGNLNLFVQPPDCARRAAASLVGSLSNARAKPDGTRGEPV